MPARGSSYSADDEMVTLARILHEAFYCERRKHGIFGSILEVRTRMYFSTIRPQTSRINFALQARTFRTSTALATKFREICGLDEEEELAKNIVRVCSEDSDDRLLTYIASVIDQIRNLAGSSHCRPCTPLQ